MINAFTASQVEEEFQMPHAIPSPVQEAAAEGDDPGQEHFDATIDACGAAVVNLVNSSPRIPTAEQITELIRDTLQNGFDSAEAQGIDAALAPHKKAFTAIEDELTELNAATGVLHLAFHDMTASGEDHSSLAQSIFFTARSIEAIVKRIEAKLLGEAAPCR
jgi:hypothetical protein